MIATNLQLLDLIYKSSVMSKAITSGAFWVLNIPRNEKKLKSNPLQSNIQYIQKQSHLLQFLDFI